MSIQSCLVPSTFAVAAIINPRYLWSRSQGHCGDFAGHAHHLHCILFRQVCSVACGTRAPWLPFVCCYSSKLIVPPVWPDVKEEPAWAQKWHCSFSAELSELLNPHSFQCFFNLVWSSWSTFLHPQFTGLSVSWNLHCPQLPNERMLKVLMDTGGHRPSKLLLDPLTTAEHPRRSLRICSNNISGDFKKRSSQKFLCTKPGTGGGPPFCWHCLSSVLVVRYFPLQKWKGLRTELE